MKFPKRLIQSNEAREDLIPEVIKRLVREGHNYFQVLHHEDLNLLRQKGRYSEDFWPFLVRYNYEQLTYLWAFSGITLPYLIEKLNQDYSANPLLCLSPPEKIKLLAITRHTKTDLNLLMKGLEEGFHEGAKENLIRFLTALLVKLKNEAELNLPFKDEDFWPTSLFSH